MGVDWHDRVDEEEEERFHARLDRVTRGVGRVLAVGIPTLLALLFVVPFAVPGIGPMPALALAVVGTTAIVVAAERRAERRHHHRDKQDGARDAYGAGVGPRPRRPSKATLVVIALWIAVVLGYVLLIGSLGR